MASLLSIIDAHPSMEQMLIFSLMGFGVVMFVLVILSFLSSFIGVFFKAAEAAKKDK